jgi:hypothetical protein
MDDRERMLSEGPRDAPEPRTAEAMTAGEAFGPIVPSEPPPETVADSPTEPEPTPAPTPSRRRSGPSWLRWAPIAVIAVLGFARALGGGGRGALVFAAIAVAVVVARILQRRNR